MTLHPGDVVGGYTIEGVIGHGGMGTVYRARHPALPRSDALKVLSAELSRDEHFRARFEREAELAASLDHPNIVTIHNRGETDGQLWIAMQYVAGSDADNEIKNHRMTPERAVHIIGEVARALDYAHRRHLLHRDIKPANFLLAPNDERVFLADFGIARALDEAVNLTQTGTVMASIAFASPEALAGEEIDHRSDVYSLGCSLYRMLTGNSPFGGRSGGMAAIAAAHMVEPPPRATDSVPNLPTAFDAVIAQAMAKYPAQRFQNAGELAQAAVRALDETTNAVRVAPAPARGPGWPGDHTPPRWPTQATGPTGPTGSIQATGPTAPTPYGPGPTPPPSGHGQGWSTGPTSPPHVSDYKPVPLKRRRRPLIAAAVAAVVLIVAGTSYALWPQDSAPSYAAQALVHEHGQATLTEQPRAVIAAGPGDADAVLSLDVQPVAIVAPDGELPSWEKDLITGDVRVLPTADAAAIAAAQPDLILDTGEIDGATYRALSEVATTITRPRDASDWTWQTQLQWTARILGHEQRAKDLIDKAAATQADLRSQHPVFDGKSIEVVLVTDDGISIASPTSPAARYLQGLGFRYPAKPAITSTDGADMQPVADPEQLNLTPTDVRIVLRTDRTAGNGSYNGLPQPFSAYRGATIIVDDPAAITALQSPGYAAVNYLNTGLVNALARQVR